MNFKQILIAILFASITVSIVSCDKEETDINPNEKGSLVLSFDNRVGDSDLVLGTGSYTNSLNQPFNISLFNYYISNIKLYNTDGTIYTVPQDESYFLVKESDSESQEVTLTNIPEGNYNKVTFTVGVDSLRSTLPIADRTGALDPAGEGSGMYWMWNSGYIFLKLEGTSTVAPIDTVSNSNLLQYHIGGFGGYSSPTINNIKTVTLSSTSQATVRTDITPEAHIYVDAAKVVNGTTNVDFSANPVVMFSPYSVNIANNYANMFTLEHILPL
jgi:hypothetical protein